MTDLDNFKLAIAHTAMNAGTLTVPTDDGGCYIRIMKDKQAGAIRDVILEFDAAGGLVDISPIVTPESDIT